MSRGKLTPETQIARLKEQVDRAQKILMTIKFMELDKDFTETLKKAINEFLQK